MMAEKETTPKPQQLYTHISPVPQRDTSARSPSTHARGPPARFPLLIGVFSIGIAVAFVLFSILLSTFSDALGLPVHHYARNAVRGYHENVYRATHFGASPFNLSKTDVLSSCAALRVTPGPREDFWGRDESDRFEPGTNATLIRNCAIFTGKDKGKDVIHGDLLLDKGIVKSIGDDLSLVIAEMERTGRNLTIVDADGAWVTPGLVDIHTHMGVLSAPIATGALDFSSFKGPILPWLRTADGLNTHDDSYRLAMAGGVTSVQVLPGSTSAIGGQAFIIKLRKTKDRSVSSMIIEPPYSLNVPEDAQGQEDLAPFRWRHLKQACGENFRPYGNRMDSIWSLRAAYTEATKIKLAQDEYCAKAEAGLWDELDGPFPQALQWEMLVDVLRGRVKVSTHCYEAVDLDAMTRLTNEFKFRIASIHHAAEAYLVPNLLKKMWSGPPAVALFATNHRYKRESFRGSEYAGRVLADEDITVIMKSDHPVINSRYLLYEAQQAHYFGLPANLALASVTSAPAETLGLNHRIGILEEGSDADVVLWDSHPLQIGATPRKVWIDGILQIPVPGKDGKETPVEIGVGKEGEEWKYAPRVPNWDRERRDAVRWDGLPPLEGIKEDGMVHFTNVKQVVARGDDGVVQTNFTASSFGTGKTVFGSVVVQGGEITCAGMDCAAVAADAKVVDLRGGVLSPGLMTYGSPLGIEEIAAEPSTGDGQTFDAFAANIPKILNDVGNILRAMDALIFGTRNALIAYRSGVTFATTSLAKPVWLAGPDAHVIAGLSVSFRTGAAHAMQRGAIIQEAAALHVVVGRSHPAQKGISVSTQIAGLRRLLYGWESQDKETGAWFRRAAEGIVPLVIEVESADIMANLLILKADVEDQIGSRMRMVFSGASEAHLLAQEISNANVGVILNPARPFPMVWDQRRILPGPPLTSDTAVVTLLQHGVVVGLGVRSAWEARNTRFDVKWAALESNGRISQEQAYTLATTNLERLLGVRDIGELNRDLVAYEGGSMFESGSKPVAVVSSRTHSVELF